jgi:hypothetical protein
MIARGGGYPDLKPVDIIFNLLNDIPCQAKQREWQRELQIARLILRRESQKHSQTRI